MKCRLFAVTVGGRNFTMGVVLSLTASFGAPALADDYLDSINAEAKRIETITRAKKELERTQAQRMTSKPAPQEAAPVAPRQGLTNMESELRQLYPAAYALYVKMDTAGKRKVLDEYLKSAQRGKLSQQAAAMQQIINDATE